MNTNPDSTPTTCGSGQVSNHIPSDAAPTTGVVGPVDGIRRYALAQHVYTIIVLAAIQKQVEDGCISQALESLDIVQKNRLSAFLTLCGRLGLDAQTIYDQFMAEFDQPQKRATTSKA